MSEGHSSSWCVASHCSGLSRCGAWTPGALASVAVAHRFSSCSSQAPERKPSSVAHGPSCSAACGIFPEQGLNLCPPHWQADSQPLRHQGSPSNNVYFQSKRPLGFQRKAKRSTNGEKENKKQAREREQFFLSLIQ